MRKGGGQGTKLHLAALLYNGGVQIKYKKGNTNRGGNRLKTRHFSSDSRLGFHLLEKFDCVDHQLRRNEAIID